MGSKKLKEERKHMKNQHQDSCVAKGTKFCHQNISPAKTLTKGMFNLSRNLLFSANQLLRSSSDALFIANYLKETDEINSSEKLTKFKTSRIKNRRKTNPESERMYKLTFSHKKK